MFTLDLDAYDKKTRPIKFSLRSGIEFDSSYFENYMTEKNLTEFDAKTTAAEGNGGYLEMHKLFVEHLAKSIATLPAQSQGVKLPDETPEARSEILRRLSFQDLQEMVSQIATDLGRPFEKAGTDLSSGQVPKEESAPASETPKAT